MVLQALTGLIYDVTAGSWTAISILAKYYLIGISAYLYKSKDWEKQKFQDRILEDSRKILTAAIILGAIITFSGLQVEALLLPISELVALTYLGFLFWKF